MDCKSLISISLERSIRLHANENNYFGSDTGLKIRAANILKHM